jgi:DNA-3-methyladenine glycosylase
VTVDFARPPDAVARDLLGATVVSKVGGELVAVRITEVEAYGGEDDPGSHAYRGRTKRNVSMYEAGGTVYVYSIYGMHDILNLVTGGPGRAGAVLVRSGIVVAGDRVAMFRRTAAGATPALARGPGNLAACLGVSRLLDGVTLGPTGPLDVLPAHPQVPSQAVSVGPRVGLRDDGRHERYWVTGDPSVSKFRPAKVRPR